MTVLYGLNINASFLDASASKNDAPCLEITARDHPLSDPFTDEWFSWHQRPDQSIALLWKDLFDFDIAASGLRISYHQRGRNCAEVLQTYLLGQALSFALILLGKEPLHATVVASASTAFAFVGPPGRGKSTLAAHFLALGHRLVTDDLMTWQQTKTETLVEIGPKRLKLFPEMAKHFQRAHGVPLNPYTQKMLLPISPTEHAESAAPLGAIFVLGQPSPRRKKATISRLTGQRAFVALAKNTFNPVLLTSGRMQTQLIALANLLRHVPVFSLNYPRSPAALAHIAEKIIAHGVRRC